MKLSILICTLPERYNMFLKLHLRVFAQQTFFNSCVEILFDNSDVCSIGEKRNRLLQKATGDYVCFIDDDDDISDNYISLLMEGISKGVDCCSLKGVITTNGKNPQIFDHSLSYKEWKTNPDNYEITYERYPNHLNCIRADIAKQFKFPEKNFGEDHEWSKQLHESGLLKTEHYIEQPIYFYKFISKK